MKKYVLLLKSLVNPVRNSSRALNPALRGGTPYGAEPGIILKCNPKPHCSLWPRGPLARREQRGIISNGVNQHGSIVIFIALALIMFLGFAALAVDIGHITVTKNELQNISDGASLAATRKLGDIYQGMTYTQQQSYVCNPTDQASIRSVAIDVGLKNVAGKKNITIDPNDVIIAKWDPTTKIPPTTDDYNQPDAVRVIARRSSSSAEGPLSNIFAKILGKDTTNVETDAVAALTAQSTVEPGNVIPVGIDEQWFINKTVFCDQVIKFYPTSTPEGCAGWNTFEHWPASESYLRKDILEPWAAGGNNPAPGAEIGDQFVFTGGTLGNNTFQAFLDLFNYMKTRDGDGDDSQWTAQVVVYENSNCGNPTGLRKIVGFATAIITNVIPPNVEITAKVICDNVEPGRGGGGEYGTKGTIPNLVE